MNDNSITSAPQQESVVYGPAPTQSGMHGGSDMHDPHRQNLAALVHRLLRGRYLIAIILAALGAIGGALGGYFSQVPKYQSDGQVRVQPVLAKILYNTETSAMLPNFNSYVNTQASLIQQDRVLNKAMASDAWQKLGRPVGPQADLDFRRSLRVTSGRDSQELITVSFVDENPNAAFIAVQEIINAYEELHGGAQEKREREKKVKVLEALRNENATKKQDLQKKIASALAEFPTDDLNRLQDGSLTQLLALQERLADKEAKLVDRGIDPKTILEAAPAAAPAPNAEPTPAADPVPPMTPEQIAKFDPEMARLLNDQARLKQNLVGYRANGLGEKNKTVIRDTAILADVEKSIRERVDLFAQGPAVRGGVPDPAGIVVSTEQLKEEYRRIKQQVEAARTSTENIKRRKVEIEGYRQEIISVEAELAKVELRLDEVNTEAKSADSQGGGRIETFLPQAPPGLPNVDPRAKMAVVGFVVGGGIPFALMLLLGLIDRRFRYADQARDAANAAPLLGILPQLPSGADAGDPEENAAAVHCVHHIRSLLQMSDDRRKVYVVTSPTAGDGKTSLTLSLAMSFTASGSRTLVIDFDLIGCGLTSRLKATRSLGIGEALVNASSNGHVIASGVPRLDLLPAGRDDARNISRISRKAVAALVDEYRDKYDCILIDTGPALGSLEVNLAASVADGVIMVVGRGQHGDRVQEALRHIRLLGATVVGMVFNRAHTTDFARSTMSKSFRSLREGDRHEPRLATAAPGTAIATSDPLARHVESDINR